MPPAEDADDQEEPPSPSVTVVRKAKIGRTIRARAETFDTVKLKSESHLPPHIRERDMDDSTKAFIAEGLLKNRFCHQLDRDEISSICAEMEYFEFEAGETIVKEGADGTYFFVLSEGALEVSVNAKVVNKMGPGSAFGGIALLYNCPRTATVVATAKSGMWGVTGLVFQATLQHNAKRRLEENLDLIEQVRILDGLSAGQKARLGTTGLLYESWKTGDVIAEEGTQPTGLYVVKTGSLQSISGGTVREKRLDGGQVTAELQTGNVFGERELLRNQVLQTSLVAASDCELVCISLHTLTQLFGEENLGARLEQAFVDSVLNGILMLQGLRPHQRDNLTKSFVTIDMQAGAEISAISLDSPPCLGVVLEGEVSGMPRGEWMQSEWFDLLSRDVASARTNSTKRSAGQAPRKSILALMAERSESVGGMAATKLEHGIAGPSGARIALLPESGFVIGLRTDRGRFDSEASHAAEAESDPVERRNWLWKMMVLMQSGPIFRGMSVAQLNGFARSMKLWTCKPEQVLSNDEIGNHFCIVANGSVALQLGADDHLVTKGGCFGEHAALFDESPTTTEAIVDDDGAELWYVSRSELQKLLPASMRADLRNRYLFSTSELALKMLRHVRLIGAGSFGSVRLVEHVKDFTRYALKRVKKQSGKVPEDVTAECTILGKASHPFVLQLFKTFETDKSVYLLTELVTGGQLYDVTHNICLNRKQAQFYIGSLVLILESLHQQGIMYRDLKPENVMLDSQGYVKLVDFGLSKTMDESQRTFSVVGTIYYMAPEVLMGKGYGYEADFWSLGVLTYELVCGQMPFGEDAGDEGDILNSILEEQLTFPSRFNDSAGKKFVEAILEKDPATRLGANSGWSDVRNHKFFKLGDSKLFSKILGREMPPPIPPSDERYSNEDELNEKISMSDSEELAAGTNSQFMEAVATTFKKFDRNGDGSIDRKELKEILQSVNRVFFTDEVIDVLMGEMDANGDGEISYQEFLGFLCSGAEDAETLCRVLNV
eukprot:TRINITY_DN1581_c0_g1_i1.p1 TRINITY_DN1581_c0_g1~~TRINITY_DN1581_c0_g1_i1.p1  ORF type:complete len:1005 (+),score=195.18 TRINITY_DN1581_c0_g1_i1:33-3047(+)